MRLRQCDGAQGLRACSSHAIIAYFAGTEALLSFILMKYNHIIWDWNGTLLNDNRAIIDAMNVLLRENRLAEIDLDWVLTHSCYPVINLYKKLGFDLSGDNFPKLSAFFFREYSILSKESPLHDGVIETLESFGNSFLKQTILSAHPEVYLYEDIKIKNIHHHFENIIGSKDQVGYGKAEYGKRWFDENDQIIPSKTLLIGDSDHDYEVANHLGVDCILIPNGVMHKSRLTHLGCPIFNSIADAINFVL